MRLLDLFCGAGGAAMGYYQAGFTEVVGVDIEPQPNYPFRFVQADAIAFLDAMIETTEDTGYALVHASPPCQRWSVATRNPELHLDLIAPVREALQIIGLPYVIENVPQAPIHADLILCGSMFGLTIRRHRWFELSWPSWGPGGCNHRGERPYLVAGHTGGRADLRHHRPAKDRDHAADLMEMPRGMPLRAYTEAIPPAYTRYIGEQFLNQAAVLRNPGSSDED